MVKVKLSLNEYNLYKSMLLCESQESDSQHKAIKYLIDKHKMSKNNAENYVRNDIRDIYHCLIGDHKAGKFTLGLVRIQKEEELDDEHANLLNEIVKFITNNETLYGKYDKDLNGMNIFGLMNRFRDVIENFEEEDKKTKTNKISNKGKYRIVGINSFEDAEQYSDYTSWCVTNFKDAYRNYTRGNKQFIFLLADGFEDLSEDDGDRDNAPFDEYGLSMIAVSVNSNDKMITATSRWNHEITGYGDHFVNTQELCDIVGMDWIDILNSAEGRKKIYSKPTRQDIEFVKKIQVNSELQNEIRNIKSKYTTKNKV